MRPAEDLDASGLRFVVLIARFNDHITASLAAAAIEALKEHGAAAVEEHWIPGAYELPLAAKMISQRGDVDAVVALGCVIRGETPHFDYVAGEAARGLMAAQLDTGVPIAFGVLTTEDEPQAKARAGGEHGNKGRDAALTAIEMALFVRRLGTGSA